MPNIEVVIKTVERYTPQIEDYRQRLLEAGERRRKALAEKNHNFNLKESTFAIELE